MVVLKTNKGEIKIELFEEKAPITVKNFLDYVNSGFYNNTIFHRVIKGFVIQGGGFEPNLVNKNPNAPIKNEASNKISNLTGTLAMARTSDPDSASSQFFINLSDNTFLDHKDSSAQGYGYCVFGKVSDGMDIVKEIAQCSTGRLHGHDDVPEIEIVIESASIIE